MCHARKSISGLNKVDYNTSFLSRQKHLLTPITIFRQSLQSILPSYIDSEISQKKIHLKIEFYVPPPPQEVLKTIHSRTRRVTCKYASPLVRMTRLTMINVTLKNRLCWLGGRGGNRRAVSILRSSCARLLSPIDTEAARDSAPRKCPPTPVRRSVRPSSSYTVYHYKCQGFQR